MVHRSYVPLAPLWRLLDSYRTVGVGSLNPNQARFHLAWDWPKGFSAVPERDWMVLKLIDGLFSEDDAISYPDVFQRGLQYGIEGGSSRYDAFDPARGAWTVKAWPHARPRLHAEFTWARRMDHDVQIVFDDQDTVSFRLKTWHTDALKVIGECQEPALSPILHAVP